MSQARTPPSDVPSWLDSGRVPSLDGLRAIAVGLVVLAHVHQTRGFPDLGIVKAIGRRGGVGVDVFFVISGFLITILILRERDRTGTLAIGAFFARRCLRILPAYVSLLVVVAVLQAMGLAHLGVRDWIAAATYTVNFVRQPAWEIGHAWSLSIEEHFYLAWPFLLASAPRLGRLGALASLSFCFAARWAVLLLWPNLTPMAELSTLTRIDSIATGCLLAFLARDDRWRSFLDRSCSKGIAVVAIGLILAGSLAASGYSAKFSVGIAYSLNAACIALLAWAAMRHPDTALGRVLNHPVVVAVGMASYSLYLWQQLFLNPHNDGFLCSFPLNLVLALIAAIFSYRVVERPFLIWKGRLSHQQPVISRLLVEELSRPGVLDAERSEAARILHRRREAEGTDSNPLGSSATGPRPPKE